MPDVYVFQGGTPAQMAYDAISRVFHEDPAQVSILVKVNTGFKGAAASGLCTHPEVVRGLIRFFTERHTRKIYVGDSSIVGVNSDEALHAAGIWDVCQEEGVECLNLDDSGMREQEIPDPIMVPRLKMSNLHQKYEGLPVPEGQDPAAPHQPGAAGHSQGKMPGLWDCGFDKSLLS